MSEVGKCKACGAEITRSTTFCRGCNTVFPEFVEITAGDPQKEDPKKTEAPDYEDLTYSSPTYSKDEEGDEPKEPPTETKPQESPPQLEPQAPPVGPEHAESKAEAEAPAVEPDLPKREPKASSPEPEPPSDPQPEPSPREEPAKAADKQAQSRETQATGKSTSGEFAVFEDPKLTRAHAGSRLLESGKKVFSSAEVIADLARETSRSPEEVSGVVDGFWEYLADVRNHYAPNNKRHWILGIPHFGTFRFRFRWKKGRFLRKLTFKSSASPSAKAHRRTYSSKWADQWSGDKAGLSRRRKISVYISERCGLPLPQSDRVFNRLLRTIRELCEGGGRIHWARRGTMGTFQVVDKKENSGRNMQTGERITVRTGRDSITGERIPEEGNEHFSFSASKGFLARLNAPDSPAGEQASRMRSARSANMSGQKAKKGISGCCGFLVIAVLSVVWLGFLWIESDEKHSDHWEEDWPLATVDAQTASYPLKGLRVDKQTGRTPNSLGEPGTRARIDFVNNMPFPIKLYWVDFRGKKELYTTLPRDSVVSHHSYVNHVWLATTLEGEPISYFVARGAGSWIAEITALPEEPALPSADQR